MLELRSVLPLGNETLNCRCLSRLPSVTVPFWVSTFPAVRRLCGRRLLLFQWIRKFHARASAFEVAQGMRKLVEKDYIQGRAEYHVLSAWTCYGRPDVFDDALVIDDD